MSSIEVQKYFKNGLKVGKTSDAKVFRENPPSYDDGDDLSAEEKFFYECFKPFEDRIADSVDEERYFHDRLGVAVMAMKIGLSKIEGSDKDAVALRNEVWMETGKHEKLKRELLDSLKPEIGENKVENLRKLDAEELLDFYKKLNGRS